MQVADPKMLELRLGCCSNYAIWYLDFKSITNMKNVRKRSKTNSEIQFLMRIRVNKTG